MTSVPSSRSLTGATVATEAEGGSTASGTVERCLEDFTDFLWIDRNWKRMVRDWVCGREGTGERTNCLIFRIEKEIRVPCFVRVVGFMMIKNIDD